MHAQHEMAQTILQRRPLPKQNASVDNRPAKFYYRRKENKEKIQSYWASDDSQSEVYSKADLYCNRPKGPRPFPRRTPRKLPKLYKTKSKISTEFDNVPSDLYCYPLNLSIPHNNSSVETINWYSNYSEFSLRRNVSKEGEINDCYSVMPPTPKPLPVVDIERKKPWRDILLEEQLLEIDRLLKDDVSRLTITDRFWTDTHIADDDDAGDKGIWSFPVSKAALDPLKAIIGRRILPAESKAFQVDTRSSSLERTVLDLKAHTLQYFPGLPLQIMDQLLSVNLSFNYFTTIPEELFNLKNITYLNMRSNPISSIPSEIKNMKKLKYLNFSFCQLSEVNVNVYLLVNLEILDLCYNLLTYCIHEDIVKLEQLKELNLDGNQLRYFPSTILYLNLRTLNIASNFTSRLFWRESCPRDPQRLMDMAMFTLMKDDHLVRVPDTIREEILHGALCPYCNGLVPGSGVTAIKPAFDLFGCRNLPLMFRVCSQKCKIDLQRASELPFVKYFTKK